MGRFSIAALCLVWVLCPLGAAQTLIEWSVLDRYRLFKSEFDDAAIWRRDRIVAAPDISSADCLLAQLAAVQDGSCPPPTRARAAGDAEVERVSSVMAQFFSRRSTVGGVYSFPYRQTRYNQARRAYEADYLYPTHVFVRASLAVGAVSAGAVCEWSSGDLMPSRPIACTHPVAVPIAWRSGDGQFVARARLQARIVNTDETVSTIIEVRDRLIASLGDSYASGEGNPDSATRWDGILLSGPIGAGPRDDERWWWQSRNSPAEGYLAEWWDGHCHRSLYNQHAVASLLMAARDPHSTVTFISFACSGAAITDGLLAPQRNPPGQAEFGPLGANPSQLEALQRALCRNRPLQRGDPALVQQLAGVARLTDPYLRRFRESGPQALSRCQQGTRRIDALLLVFGGNDVGFSGAIADVLLPSFDLSDLLALRTARGILGAVSPTEARERVEDDLPQLFHLAVYALNATFGDARPTIVQTPYPSPLHNENGRYCDGPNDNQLFGALHGPISNDWLPVVRRWRFEIDAREALNVGESIIDPLNAEIGRNIEHGWIVADQILESFRPHGWCAARDEAEKSFFEFPRATNALRRDRQGPWSPRPPGGDNGFAPYPTSSAEMPSRWYRMPNDAVLTQLASTRSSGLGPLRVRVGTLAAISGLFHPNYLGHAAAGLAIEENLARQPGWR